MGSVSVQAFTPEVKHAIFTRQDGRCAACGLRVERGHFHHRRPRRAGGGKDPRLGQPPNGLLLHPACHDTIESRREWAYERGFLLRDRDIPEECPVKTWEGWMMLTGDRQTPFGEVRYDGDRLGV